MILLKDDQAGFEAYLAPEAHWFGANRAELHQNYFNVLPNEEDTSLERYRDLVLLDSQPEKKRYLVGYTTHLKPAHLAVLRETKLGLSLMKAN